MVFLSATKDFQQQWKLLKKSADYREFLKTYLELNSLKYSDFARTVGFGRSFPSDVATGRRRLTTKSYPVFESGLKLPALPKKFFKLLVANEEPELFQEFKKNPQHVQSLIKDLRTKDLPAPRREAAKSKNPEIESLIKNPEVLSVYAAAGEPGRGASLAQIQTRTQLDLNAVQRAIRELEKVQLIQWVKGIYEPLDLHIFFKSQDAQSMVVSLFKQACQKASQKSETGLSSEEEFYFTSRFCVEKEKLPELKKALRETILKFVDDSIAPEGNRVASLVTALHI